MKNETLEEATERFANNFTDDENKFAIEDFIAGAKWQQERSYSEEEVLKMLNYFGNEIYIKQWFEEFIKK